jgi:DNA-binding NarL/FixJ family response regulator
MNTRTRVLIADDHEIFRLGLVKTIEQDSSFTIIAQARDGKEALALIQSAKPDIAILDISMPGMNGLDVGRAVYEHALPTELVFLTMHKEIGCFNAAMDIGARGYLLKDNASADLISCLKAVADGKHYISPTISYLLVGRQKNCEALARDVPTLQQLSPAELRILKLMAENLSCKEIAAKIFISVRTVENHRNHICHKLGIKGHNQLLRFVLENKSAL